MSASGGRRSGGCIWTCGHIEHDRHHQGTHRYARVEVAGQQGDRQRPDPVDSGSAAWLASVPMQNRTSDDARKKEDSASTEAAGDGLYTHEWTGREERVGSRRQKTRRTRKGCAAPDQARRAETETGDGRPRGSFWWGGREIDGGQRERNRSSLHVSKGQPLPQYVLARCLQTGCTFRRKWTRLCLDSAVGSASQSDRQRQQQQQQ